MNGPTTVAVFLESVSESVRDALRTLAAAVVLTDETALQLLEEFEALPMPPSDLVKLVRACDFVVQRNSEWHIEASARLSLLQQLHANPKRARMAHQALLTVAANALPELAGKSVPTYLTRESGFAYHIAPFAPNTALEIFRREFTGQPTGDQWMLGILAEEQQTLNALPPGAVEPSFFRGLTLYKEGAWQEAEPYLQRVADSRARTIEVAIALHLLAIIALQRDFAVRRAESLLRRSLAIGEEIQRPYHVAHVLHSLGNVVRNPADAERFLRRSLAILEDLGDTRGVAQVLHSLGNVVRNSAEAERLLNRSLAIGEEIHQPHHVAQVLHSLGNIVDDSVEAEQLLRRSLTILEDIGDAHGVAQVLNSLGNRLRQRGDIDSASDLYEAALLRSDHPVDRVVAHLGLSRVAEAKGDFPAAVRHMRAAIDFQIRTGRADLVERHRERLAALERRV